MNDTLRLVESAVRSATEKSAPDEILSVVHDALDEMLGGMVAVFHVAGEHVYGMGQLCSRCGKVLTDSMRDAAVPEGQEGDPMALRWESGQRVVEMTRWGAETWPRALWITEIDPSEPDERWCDDAIG